MLPKLDGQTVINLEKAVGKATDFHEKTDDIPPLLFDKHNCDLFDQVRPVRWSDPQAKVSAPNSRKLKDVYDMLVIGAGAGGLVTAAGSHAVGAKVAIIERKFMGGDCLNFGCVPSKALLAAAKAAHMVRKEAAAFGIRAKAEVDFPHVMERMRKIRAEISENDSVERFQQFLGVDIFLGDARFISAN